MLGGVSTGSYVLILWTGMIGVILGFPLPSPLLWASEVCG